MWFKKLVQWINNRTLVYYFTSKTLKSNSLVQKNYLQSFLRKSYHTTEAARHWVHGDPSTIFLATSFTWKMLESSDSMYSSIFMLENTWYYNFTWSGPNSQEIVNFDSIMGPRGPELNWNKIQWYHMFFSMKMDEYMEPGLSDIFWLKLVPKK